MTTQIHVVNGDRLIKTPWREVAAVEKYANHHISSLKKYFGFNFVIDLREVAAVEKYVPTTKIGLVVNLQQFWWTIMERECI